MLGSMEPSGTGEYDVFVSHASEDKDFAAPLASALTAAGMKVWYDEYILSIGDSLRQKIDTGLARSRFGIVVISPHFLRKNWTQYELDGLHARQMTGERIILPVWHRITRDEIIEHAPSLADILSLSSASQSLEEIVKEIGRKVGSSESHSVGLPPPPAVIRTTGPSFAVFHIAQAHTPELPQNEIPRAYFSAFQIPAAGWLSVVTGDEELEYALDGTTLRVRLDWGNQWTGDELIAHRLVTGDQPFALILRPNGGDQSYFPSIINTSPSRGLMSSSRSGWMVFAIQQ